MYKILSLSCIIIYASLNVANSEGKQCYFCNADDVNRCSPPHVKKYDCHEDTEKCFSFAGLDTERNKPIYFRGCYEGGCESLEKRVSKLKSLYCKSCKGSNCNNEKFPDVMPMGPKSRIANLAPR